MGGAKLLGERSAAGSGALEQLSFSPLDRYFERINEQETRRDLIERAVRALKVLAGLETEGARSFQLALAALDNAYSCCDAK